VSVNEITWLKVKSAQRVAFVKEAHTFAKILADDGGCQHVEMFMGVENPDSFVFVITWDSRDAHKAFKGNDRGRQAISSIVSYLAITYKEPAKGTIFDNNTSLAIFLHLFRMF
jgi:quinol monooxygenase YgiN